MFRLASQRQGLAVCKNEAEAKGNAVARGFLSGILWGGLFSVAVAGTVSVLNDGPHAPRVVDSAPDGADVPLESTQAPVVPMLSESEAGSSAAAPQAVQQAVDASPSVETDTDAGAVPQVSAQTTDIQSPVQSGDAGDVPVARESAVVQSPQTPAPQVPASETDPSVSTETATPIVPEVTEQNIAVADVPPQVPQTPEAMTSGQAGIQQQPGTDTQPESGQVAELEPAPKAEIQPESGVVSIPPEVSVQPDPLTLDPVDMPETKAEETTETAGPKIGAPARNFSTLAPDVATNRLPSLGAKPEVDAETQIVAAVPDASLPPIQRFAAPFENPDNKPLMAIVLMDDGNTLGAVGAGGDALRSFPYPITFAVDTRLPDAKARMQAYRAQGFEVMVILDLPETSSATDTEVSMGVALNAVNEAVAALEGVDSGIQGNREMSGQVTAILADAGLGLVTQPNGLNTVQKLATRAGVPAATLLRDFDSEGQSRDVIRRFLDQAAFRAGQDGRVIMVGRLRPDTISALLLWGLQDRIGRVALAPVSVLLQQE